MKNKQKQNCVCNWFFVSKSFFLLLVTGFSVLSTTTHRSSSQKINGLGVMGDESPVPSTKEKGKKKKLFE